MLLSILLAVIFLGSTGMVLRQSIHYKNGDQAYHDAEKLSGISQADQTNASSDIAEAIASETIKNTMQVVEESVGDDLQTVSEQVQPEEPVPQVWIPEPVTQDAYVESLQETDLEALREVNPDVIGWIMIPDTVINYPLLQGEDNQYYLDYTWDLQRNAVGSIFLECTNNSDLTDFHTIIYGHNMKAKTMFSAIRSYKSKEFQAAHPYVYIVSDAGVYRYEVYASYEADVTSYTYRLGFSTDEDKQDFIELGVEQSVIDTGIVPEITDRILTLSTCTGNGHATRWVVHARLKMITENLQEGDK